jgi:peroxiredoxin
VIGISTDTNELQERFAQKEKLTFPLVADAEKKITRAFGVLSVRGVANRVTFVIDKKGIIRKVIEVKNIDQHPDDVLAFVKENLGK